MKCLRIGYLTEYFIFNVSQKCSLMGSRLKENKEAFLFLFMLRKRKASLVYA